MFDELRKKGIETTYSADQEFEKFEFVVRVKSKKMGLKFRVPYIREDLITKIALAAFEAFEKSKSKGHAKLIAFADTGTRIYVERES